MKTTKRFMVLVLAAMMALSVFSGCKKDKESGKASAKVSTENVEKYFLYTEAEKLYCLDATTGKSTPIGLDFAVDAVENGLVCDDSTKMVARVKKLGQEISGLIYWDGRSEKASYLGDNTDLVRVSKDGNYIWYEEAPEGNGTLYCYDAGKAAATKLVEGIRGAAVSDDGKSAFVTTVFDVPNRQEDTLYYCEADGKMTLLAEVERAGTSVPKDRSFVVYTKKAERYQDLTGSGAYLWTKSGGEKKLPFEATEVYAFAEDEIYYLLYNKERTRASYYYYDGKDTHLLTETGQLHGHKAGDFFYYEERGTEDEFKSCFVHKGQVLETNIRFCPQVGLVGFTSYQNGGFYGWSMEENKGLYRVSLDKDGKLVQTRLMDSETYAPRWMTFSNGNLLQTKDDGIYLNGKKIAEAEEGVMLSAEGEVVTFKENESADHYLSAQGGRVVAYKLGGGVTICAKDGKAKAVDAIKEVTSLVLAETWSITTMGETMLKVEQTGAWYIHGIQARAVFTARVNYFSPQK